MFALESAVCCGHIFVVIFADFFCAVITIVASLVTAVLLVVFPPFVLASHIDCSPALAGLIDLLTSKMVLSTCAANATTLFFLTSPRCIRYVRR